MSLAFGSLFALVDNTAVTLILVLLSYRFGGVCTQFAQFSHSHHTSVRLTNLKNLMERHVCYPDVVFSIHRDSVRHVEEVAAPVADDGARSGVQR